MSIETANRIFQENISEHTTSTIASNNLVNKQTMRHDKYSLHYTTHDTRLTHGHRKLSLAEDFEILRLTPDFEILRLTCDFKTLRQTPARRPPDAHQTPARRNFLKSGVRRKILKCCV